MHDLINNLLIDLPIKIVYLIHVICTDLKIAKREIYLFIFL